MRIVKTTENTYGFEMEFCTHDNTILRYTHIEVATIKLKGNAFPVNIKISPEGELTEEDNKIPLKLETDSGDVLELVTPPIIFTKLVHAVEFRKRLAEYLKNSVNEPLTFDKWMGIYANELVTNMSGWYSDIEKNTGKPIEADGRWKLIRFDKIAPNISVNNIDDGINIAAANYRKSTMDGERWETELSQTVLCASTKDWPRGFSTQTSIPMQVTDYVVYVLYHKLLKSTANLKRLKGLLESNQVDKIEKTLLWDKVERWATTWFWGGVIFDLFHHFVNSVKSPADPEKFEKSAADVNKIAELTHFHFEKADQIKWSSQLGTPPKWGERMAVGVEIASLFIIAQKTLTGALGSLSENQQLTKQRSAFEQSNAAAMEQRDFVRQPADGKFYWCEYHSGLKDLLGVWFKGHLADVLLELVPNGKTHIEFGKPDNSQLTNIYTLRLKEVTAQLEKFKRMPFLPDFTFISEDEMLQSLVKAHIEVINATTTFVNSGRAIWSQADREQKFLEYSTGKTLWEGRKDTMIGPIKHKKSEKDDDARDTDDYETFFLVEHRNN